MKIKILTIMLALLALTDCNFRTRVIRETEKNAVIVGIGMSKTEAMINAEERAKDMFGNFKQTAQPDCNEGMSGSASRTSAHVGTYISCTIQVEKQ